MKTRPKRMRWTGIAVVIFLAVACRGGGRDDSAKTATPASPTTNVTSMPGASERATLRGTLTLDGAPFDADFLGARVLRDGLAGACQDAIPTVAQGRYEIPVASDAEVRGCGVPGADVLLWVYKDGFIFSKETTRWPGSGATVQFDATFSSAAREGTGKPVTEFKGHLFDRDGSQLPGGTVIEAYVGDALCVTSLRRGDATEGYYTLVVAGPESVAGCAIGATLTFRLDGRPAVETAINDLGRGRDPHDELNLTAQ